MARTVVDLDARATVLEAAERIAAAPPGDDVALVVAPGAPVMRSAVFLEVLRGEAGPRRLAVVTTDGRARSIASSVHLPAYASIAALERKELDPTERLDKARRAAVASTRPATVGPPRFSPRRLLAIAGSLAAAFLLVAAIALPEARVVVAPASQPLGPMELVIRAGSGGEVASRTLSAQVTGKVTMNASGSRTDEVRAKGTVQLENKTTDDVRIGKGTIFKTVDGTQFLSSSDVTLPKSVILPPFTLFVGKASVGVDAFVAGPVGNVASGRITTSPDPSRYTVTNSEPTTGGETRRIPIVKLEDYDGAVKRAPDALKAAGEEQLAKWTRDPHPNEQVVQQVLVRQTSLAPSNVDLVGKEVASFDLTVSGTASAFVIPDAEPKKAIVSALRGSVSAGNEVDERSVAFDVKSLRVGDDGVTWSVTARGQQIRSINKDRVSRLLTGRAVRDAQAALAAEGLELKRLDWVPAWWPLLPLLDTRIAVQVEAPAIRAGP